MCLSLSIREKNRRRNWPQRFSLTPWLQPGVCADEKRLSCFNSFSRFRLVKAVKTAYRTLSLEAPG